MTDNTWQEYKILVLKELEGFTRKSEKMDDRLDKLDTQMAVLTTKLTIVLAGCGTIITALVVALIKILAGG